MKRRNGWTVVVVALIVALALAGLFFPNRAEAPLQIGAQAVRERIAIKARADSYIYNGADVIWYSDELSTETGRIDGAGGMQLAIPTAQTTATPGFLINCAHLGTCVEVRDAGTPVWTISNGGGIAHTGDETYAGGSTFNNWVKAAAPTAIVSTTPGVVIDSLGVSNILEVRDAATPVFTIEDGGDVVQTGARTASGGDTINNWLVVSAPTAIATATPGAVVDSLGVSNILEVRDAATPVFTIEDGGDVTGKVVRYATAGQQMVVGTSASVTETVVAAHGLTTVTFALCTLGEDVDTDAGDPVVCTAAVSGNVVTLSLWEDDWSAAGTAASVHWLVVGTP